jgi:thimet oligopeptidase
MARRLASLAALLALAACGPALQADRVDATIPAIPATAGPRAADGPDPADEPFDPVEIGLTAPGVKRLCDDHLASAETLLERVRALKGAAPERLTYEATFGRLDRVARELQNGGSFPYLMAVAHPDPALQEAAKICETKTGKFTTDLYLDPDLAAVFRAYAAKNEPLAGARKRLVEETLRDFRRGGIDLPPEKKKRLSELSDEIVKLGQEFESRLAKSVGKVEVRKAQLAGLPPEYVKKHAPTKDGKVVISTDYPDYFPFIRYARDRKAALELYVAFTNRGGEDNVQTLERLLKLRHEKAQMLGYASWADYAIEPRMAKNAKAVRGFLAEATGALKEPAKAELAELLKVHAREGGKRTDKLAPPDRYYLEDRVRSEKFKFDSKEIQAYFEVGAVTKGLLELTAEMYGIVFKPIEARTWHPDVKAYEVRSGGEYVGRLYLDLHSRDGKYKHMAMFPIITPVVLPSGERLHPIAALECNFPKPGAEPALMSHEDVETFFHEFGHALHHLLTRAELATYAGTNTARDFVEAPSQMFEEWAWSREVLDRFARHHKTGAKIPDDLFKAMKASRAFGRALGTQRQIFLATLDLELHSRPPGFDSTRVVEEVQEATDSFAYVKGTHFQSTFGHLIGYDAGYYGYQWALALARDALTRFKKEGLLNHAAATAWRDEVLAKGGGPDEREMLARFLGRQPNNEAYFAFLRGQD